MQPVLGCRAEGSDRYSPTLIALRLIALRKFLPERSRLAQAEVIAITHN